MTPPPFRERRHNPMQSAGLAGRFIAGVFGFVFFGVGVTVIVSLWTAGGFDDPPLFFKIVGSFISLAFIAGGGTMAVAALFGGGLLDQQQAIFDEANQRLDERPGTPASAPPPAQVMRDGHYVCPNCGATLGDRAEVSPLGDVKCPFCGSWFNIHGRK